jgi:hypothetical protein
VKKALVYAAVAGGAVAVTLLANRDPRHRRPDRDRER